MIVEITEGQYKGKFATLIDSSKTTVTLHYRGKLIYLNKSVVQIIYQHDHIIDAVKPRQKKLITIFFIDTDVFTFELNFLMSEIKTKRIDTNMIHIVCFSIKNRFSRAFPYITNTFISNSDEIYSVITALNYNLDTNINFSLSLILKKKIRSDTRVISYYDESCPCT